MTIADELGRRIAGMRYEALPPEAVDWAKISFIDTIACALAAAPEAGPRIVEKVLTPGGKTGPSLIWGTDRRVSSLDAAAINGTAAHALDYDDCNNSLAGHPSAAVLPAVLALGELTPERTATALAISVSLASGVKANFGTMTKPLHAGQCTRNGLYAALLAREGFTASAEAFEHKHGFLNVFNGAGNFDAEKILAGWADPLDILAPGVGLKQYPCCGSTHSAIDATILLRERHGLTPERVAGIESVTHDRALAHTDRPLPASALDAKFSVQYCVARALMHGDVTFEHFEGDAWRDPEVRKLLGRIRARPHAHQSDGMYEHFQGEVIVTTTEGVTYSARVDQPLRGPQNPAPPDRLEPKFRDCAARALRADAVSRVLETLRNFESLDNVRELTELMAASVKARSDTRVAA
ncbi:MAG: MmgE/PrpD family protein [Betaproteobacteria bacterium]|nr:MmgE/PrpD family protein [Betaproteobacteria bacterium]